MTQSRDAILLEILRAHKDQHLTVTSARNEILRQDNTLNPDRAALRRWVNGKFSTLVRRGLLEKQDLEHGKAHFLVLSKSDKDFADVVLRQRPNSDLPASASPSTESMKAYNQLRKELDGYRLKAASQLGEIDEYRRVGEAFPNLRSLAQERFEKALDENCRVLGRIRALEHLISNAKAQ